MSQLPKQTKRRDLIKRFRSLGFDGPLTGKGKHPEFMRRGAVTVKLPNEHRGDIREVLLKLILEQAGVTEEEWLAQK